MTFARRIIDVRFHLGKGSFGEDGADTVDLKGLRCAATITKSGGVSMTELNLRIWGAPLSTMNALTILGKPITHGRNNTVIISAGDEVNGVAVVFAGLITEAWVDPRAAPQVSFVVTAHTGYLDALKPVPATSYNGSVSAATIVAGIAAQMTTPGIDPNSDGKAVVGLAFENGGVDVQLRDVYLAGTLLDQLQSIARAGNFNAIIDNGTVAIWPADGTRGGEIPLISPSTGMVGYPVYTQNGISVTTLFNPAIIFGGKVKVETDLTPAAGLWSPYAVSHELASETPGGPWFTRLECNLFGQPQAIAT